MAMQRIAEAKVIFILFRCLVLRRFSFVLMNYFVHDKVDLISGSRACGGAFDQKAFSVPRRL
jgi:hypothetical protein